MSAIAARSQDAPSFLVMSAFAWVLLIAVIGYPCYASTASGSGLTSTVRAARSSCRNLRELGSRICTFAVAAGAQSLHARLRRRRSCVDLALAGLGGRGFSLRLAGAGPIVLELVPNHMARATEPLVARPRVLRHQRGTGFYRRSSTSTPRRVRVEREEGLRLVHGKVLFAGGRWLIAAWRVDPS